MTITALLLILILVVGSGTMAVLLGWMWHRISKLEGGREDRSELGNVYQQLDALRDQVFAAEDEMARLNERVAFPEKLLDAPRVGASETDEPSGAP
mgnify:FL=1